MITELHFLRPWWFLAFIPLIIFALSSWRQTPKLHAWAEVCDSHLLKHLLQSNSQGRRFSSLLCLYISAVFMIVSLTGPTWYKYPVATYKPIQPRVIVLDMSENMLAKDLTPDRLSRAKFKLHDLFSRKGVGQFGMVVFTGEPFVVSPLTDDGETIAALLSTLTPDVMPVGGQNLDTALTEASQLIKQAGYNHGQILILTAEPPSSTAINQAKKLAQEGIHTSILPMRAEQDLNPLFQNLATSGKGELILYSADSTDLQEWLDQSGTDEEFKLNDQDDIPLWRDEGRWFLIGALLFLLPVFQRGW
ncbi:MAG: VWA domain-containing protein, partial [Legionella sp.]